MLDDIFLQILNMSLTSGIVILFVLAARLLLRKAPKIFSYALWAVVLFRLVCPFSFESAVSLLPERSEPVTPEYLYSQELPEFVPGNFEGGFEIGEDFSAVPEEQYFPAEPEFPVEEVPEEPAYSTVQILTMAGIALWLAGIAALLIYSGISLIKLKKNLKTAVCQEKNVYFSDRLATPFVIGVFRPRIYLPANLTEEETQYILLHEQTHIKRLDHIVKLVSYLVLCVHWFNPLVWAAFFLSGKDMEMSCDEAVIKKLGGGVKKDYSSSLLALATGKRIVGGSPLAFGEGNTKGRIKNVLNYKKPAFWVIIAALAGVILLTVGLVTNPVGEEKLPSDEEISAVLAQFENVDRKEIQGFESAMCATEWSAFVLDIDNDKTAEIGVAYNDYRISEVLFYKRRDGGFVPYYTLGDLPSMFQYYDIEVYKDKDGVVLHTRRNDPALNIEYYFDVYADFRGDEPEIHTPWYSLSEEGDHYYNTNYSDPKEISKEEYEKLTGEILSGMELKEIITIPDKPDEESLSVITDGPEAISCEYGINRNSELDAEQMIEKLDGMRGFVFSEDEVESKYVKLKFPDEAVPNEISARYCADVDNIWLEETYIDITFCRISVPRKPGTYDYFVDVTITDNIKETVYFRITIESAGHDITPEEAKRTLLEALGVTSFFDSEKLTVELKRESPVTAGGRNCYAFEEKWKPGAESDGRKLNSYAVSVNGRYIYSYKAESDWWYPFNKTSNNITPLEYLDQLRDSMVIVEENGELYAKMTVPDILPEGCTANMLQAGFYAYSINDNTMEGPGYYGGHYFDDDLFKDHPQLSELSYRLEAGKTYTQKIDKPLDDDIVVERIVVFCITNGMKHDYLLRDRYMYNNKNGTDEEQEVLVKIRNSLTIKDGYASITIPEKLPDGYAPEDLFAGISIQYPYDGLNLHRQELFSNTVLEAGKTYTEKLEDKIYEGSLFSAGTSYRHNKLNFTSVIDQSWTKLEPEAHIIANESVTLGDCMAKLNAVLKKNLPAGEFEWELKKKSEDNIIINGRRAFMFDQNIKGGTLIDTYAITDDFKKLYRVEYDVSPAVWQELKFDMGAETASLSPEAFLAELRDSMVIEEKNGELYAKMTVPDAIPKGYPVTSGDIGFTAYNIDNRFEEYTLLFEKHPQLSDRAYKLEAGKTYTQKIDIKPDKNTVLGRFAEFEAAGYDLPDRYTVRDARMYNTSNEAEQAFLEEIYNSISIKNGEAKITIPKKLPAGRSMEDLYVRVALFYPGADGYGEDQYFFKDIDFKAGKTYTEKLADKIYTGTRFYIHLDITGGEKFKVNDIAIAEIDVSTYPAPEADFDRDAKMIELAGEKLTAILENVLDESNWALDNGKKATVDGETAHTFDVNFKDGVPAMGGGLIGYYAISGDFTKVYEMDRTAEKWELKYDLMKSTPELEAFAKQIFDSMTIENGVAKIVIPKEFPKGYSKENLDVTFHITYPDGQIDNPLWMNQRFEAGKTYTGKLSRELTDGTRVYRDVFINVEGKGVVQEYSVKNYPLRKDDYTPKSEILPDGVEFTDKYGDTFKVTMNLPEGWSFKESTSPDSADIYKDGKAVGELFYSDFRLYEGVTGDNYYRSVYTGLMLGSVITWDNEYKVITKTENGSVDTCRPMQRETEGGLNPVVTYSNGILAHDRSLLRYMAMSVEDGAVTPEEWEAIAKTVKLSGTKK